VNAVPLLLLLAAGPPARAGVEQAVAAALAAAPAGGARAAAATAPLLGLPYRLDPLGEGSGPDPDPRFRLDAFDCMTLVETAVALGASATLEEARRALDDVRYDGPPALANRGHEVLSQWIPANLAKGWIAPLRAPPREAGGGGWPERQEVVTYDAARWARLARSGQALRGVPPERRPLGRFEVAVVPPEAFAAAGPHLPEGTIAFVVREDAPDRLTRVSHAGLVVVGPRGERRVRHASSTAGVARVIEEPLDRFVARQRAASRRALSGLALFTLRDHPVPAPPLDAR
jgi:hypothetical protein